jgi:MoxR-like ATPase
VLDPTEAPARVEALRRLVREVLVAPHIERYAAQIVRLTAPVAGEERDELVTRYVSYGASPRGGQALVLGAKVLALIDGRPHVAYEDVDRVAHAALGHRLVMGFAAEAAGVGSREVVDRVLAAARRLRA